MDGGDPSRSAAAEMAHEESDKQQPAEATCSTGAPPPPVTQQSAGLTSSESRAEIQSECAQYLSALLRGP